MITNFCCDLLKNIYLCGINNNSFFPSDCSKLVVICLKISIFVVSTTTYRQPQPRPALLWFAWKYLSLWYQQQHVQWWTLLDAVVICLKISTSVVSTTTACISFILDYLLWCAWKYLPLRYQQQRLPTINSIHISCDLLENIYLCGINNNIMQYQVARMVLWFAWKYLPLRYQQQPTPAKHFSFSVVICLKISTFAVSTTTVNCSAFISMLLWFAWKYLPLRYQQQHWHAELITWSRCDLLENIYLCGINNNHVRDFRAITGVVICLKISTFAVSTTTLL